MADRQRAGITGNATMRVPITGDVNVGGRSVRELRFMPRSAFPEVGRSDVLYIDTLGECIYYWDGGEYVQLSGGGSGTDNYNSLQNRPKINNVTLEGEQTSSDLGLQSSIDDLSSIRSGAAAGATALQPEDVDTLPTDGSSNPVSSGGTYNFVNSSIATNTAYFIGTFASVAELEAYSGTVTNNDYAFVTSTDSAGNTLYNRYKYNGSTQTWGFEYAVNNTSFTSAQWATIQSGMTSADKTKLDGIETGATKTVIDSSPTSASGNAVSSGGVYTALAGKQDTISDLSTIRSGASAGATAVQTIQIDGTAQTKTNGVVNLPAYPTTLPASDVTSTYSASGTAPVNGTAVNAAIGTLNATEVGGSGKYISAISETNGKIEATAETMDTVPTSGSTKAVTSGGVQAPLAEVINSGAKNVLKTYDVQSTTTGNVTYSVSSGVATVSISGTQTTAKVLLYAMDSDVGVTTVNSRNTIPKGTYILKTTGNGKVKLRAIEHDGTNTNLLAETTGSDAEFTYTGAMPYVTFTLSVSSNTSLSEPLTFIPMCCLKSLYAIDSTAEPYALSNPVLTPALIEQVDEGSKNKFQITNSPSSSIVTVNADQTVSVVGSTGSSNVSYTLGTFVGEVGVKYHISGCPAGGSSSTWRITLSGIEYDYGDGFDYISDGTARNLTIFVKSGQTVNLNFKPMICTAADWAVSQKYVPYCPTNRELYEMIKALQTE